LFLPDILTRDFNECNKVWGGGGGGAASRPAPAVYKEYLRRKYRSSNYLSPSPSAHFLSATPKNEMGLLSLRRSPRHTTPQPPTSVADPDSTITLMRIWIQIRASK
jgi:hypothetical protein